MKIDNIFIKNMKNNMSMKQKNIVDQKIKKI